MEKHALQTLLSQRFVPGEVAVFIVAGERKAKVRQMNADLMRASGAQLRLEQAHRRFGSGPNLAPVENRRRCTSVALDTYPTLAFSRDELVQRQLDLALLIAPPSVYQHEVALVDPPFAQRRVQRSQRRSPLCDQQHAGGFAIEPVHELQEGSIGTGCTQLLDHPEAHPAAAVDRDSRRLVDRQ